MGGNTGLSAKDEAIRELAFGDVSTTYVELGVSLVHDAKVMVLDNQLNANVYISFDGVTDHKKFKAGQTRVIDLDSNEMYRKKGTQVWVRDDGTGASSGWVALEVTYS